MPGEPVQFMSQMVSIEYPVPQPTLVSRAFADQLAAGRIVGHRCPSCGKVYVPPRGYCPLCVVSTTDADEVEVADRGTVTTYSVITPIQYPGQEEQDDYVLATVLLDGADMTIGQQRLDGIPIEDVHSGMRVLAVWAPETERKGAAGPGPAGGLGAAVTGWRPTGEPDAPLDDYAEHIL
ncbi:MAG: Zn-ribbon domain-containing OB-fold protein [Acidimicrobiia bacterium]